MESKKFFALWLLAFGGCITVAKQGMDSGEAGTGVPGSIKDIAACGSDVLLTVQQIRDLIKQIEATAEQLRSMSPPSDDVANAIKCIREQIFASFVGYAKLVLAPSAAPAAVAAAQACNDAGAVNTFDGFIKDAQDVLDVRKDIAGVPNSVEGFKTATKVVVAAANNLVRALGFFLIASKE